MENNERKKETQLSLSAQIVTSNKSSLDVSSTTSPRRLV